MSAKKDVGKRRIVDSRYQPTKAEMEEDVSIDASPEEMARAVMSSVGVKVVRSEKVKNG